MGELQGLYLTYPEVGHRTLCFAASTIHRYLTINLVTTQRNVLLFTIIQVNRLINFPVEAVPSLGTKQLLYRSGFLNHWVATGRGRF